MKLKETLIKRRKSCQHLAFAYAYSNQSQEASYYKGQERALGFVIALLDRLSEDIEIPEKTE